MTIWITRSAPGAEQLARALQGAGYQTRIAAVIETRSLNAEAPPGAFDLAVVLSAACASRLAEVADRCARVLAIGPATRDALAAEGVDAAVAAEASSEGILAEVGAAIEGARVLVVRGEGGREILAPGLEDLGAEVQEWLVYRREPCSPEVDPGQIEAIVTSSGDGVRQAGRVWFSANGDAAVPVVVPSDRVAEIARTAGFEQVLISQGAGAEAVLAVLTNR